MELPLIGHQSLVGSQGSVPRPVLVKIYINDKNVGLNTFTAKFDDDTKIGNSVTSGRDSKAAKEICVKYQHGQIGRKCISTLKKKKTYTSSGNKKAKI